ncbi:MAG: hypothetical protein PVH30_09700 [Desulfobacterales bacterium]|jgi:hypothetical protein
MTDSEKPEASASESVSLPLSCSDHRQAMILTSLRNRLKALDLCEDEKEKIKAEVALIEASFE